MWGFATVGADTFQHEVYGTDFEVSGQREVRYIQFFETVDLVTALAIEMRMHIVNRAMFIAVTDFVFLDTATIFEIVDKITVEK